MDEMNKNRLLDRLVKVRHHIKRISLFANMLMVLYSIVWLIEIIAYYFADVDYGDSYGIPFFVLLFLLYVIKVITIEYLQTREDMLQKEVDNLYDQEKKTV